MDHQWGSTEIIVLLVLWEIIILGLSLPPQRINIFQLIKRIIISTKPQWWSTLYINKIILNRIDLEKINTYASDKLNIYYGLRNKSVNWIKFFQIQNPSFWKIGLLQPSKIFSQLFQVKVWVVPIHHLKMTSITL